MKFISYVRTDQLLKAYITKNCIKAFFIILSCVCFFWWGLDLLRYKYDEAWMVYAKTMTFMLTAPLGFLIALIMQVNHMKAMLGFKRKKRKMTLEKLSWKILEDNYKTDINTHLNENN